MGAKILFFRVFCSVFSVALRLIHVISSLDVIFTSINYLCFTLTICLYHSRNSYCYRFRAAASSRRPDREHVEVASGRDGGASHSTQRRSQDAPGKLAFSLHRDIQFDIILLLYVM